MKGTRLITATAFVLLGMALTLGFLRLWGAMYPDPGDPKNLAYVLWKHGLNSDMDLDTALATMTHDTWAVNRVTGLTPHELQKRFGFTKTYDQVDSYLQLCDTPAATGELDNHPIGHDVLYLRGDWWMVIMKNGRAANLVLCKGY